MKKHLLIYSFILLLPVSLTAQINIGNNLENISYERPVEYEIAGITVEGIQNLDKNAIITLSGLNVGNKIMVPGEDLSKAITKLWDQNLFADIRIDASKVMGSNVFLEIRAGTGGDEAAIFAGDIFRMYARYCEKNGWSLEILNQNETGQGGFKEVIAKVEGSDVFSKLKFESGTHRVQRIPKTESQGRIHTSACTVAIIAEADEMNEVEISNNDLRVDTYRASGAGGQHVNKTDSAVRLTHIPTGIVAECQDNRSQHKNRAKALSLLKAKIYDMEQKKIQDQQAEERKMLVGSGDRSERIRTYNYPQGRITDHRINLTQYNLAEFMEGDLDTMIDTLVQENAAKQMAQLDD